MCFSDIFSSLWYTSYFLKSKEFKDSIDKLSEKTGFDVCFHDSYVDFISNGNVVYSFIYEIGDKYKLDNGYKIFDFLYPRLFEIKNSIGELTDEEIDRVITKIIKIGETYDF